MIALGAAITASFFVAALRGFANVGNDVLRLDRTALDELSDRRGNGRLIIDKGTYAGTFEEGDAPAVSVMISQSPASCKTGETENDVGGGIAIHPE